MAVSTIKGMKTGTFTPSSGVTIQETEIKQDGHNVYVRISATRTGNFPTSQQQVGNVSGVDLPKTLIRTICGAGANAYGATDSGYLLMDTDGGVYVQLSTARPRVNICFTYIV